MSAPCSPDEIYSYFKRKEEDYSRNIVYLESLDQELQSMGSNIVDLLRSNNKAASDAVLLSKSQAKTVEEVTKNTETYLRAYNDLSNLAKEKPDKPKCSAESFVSFNLYFEAQCPYFTPSLQTSEVKRIVYKTKEKLQLTEALLDAFEEMDANNTGIEESQEQSDSYLA